MRIPISSPIYSQASRETSCLVLNHRWLWWFTHDDEFLVRLHDDTGKLWKPNSHMNKSVSLQHAAPREVGDFKFVIHVRLIRSVRFDCAGIIIVGIYSSIVSKQRMTLESNWFLQLCCDDIA